MNDTTTYSLGDRTVNRLGYGAMQLAGPGVFGPPKDREAALAEILLDLFRKEGDLVVGDNEPYHVSDETDYGIPVHGERRGIPHVELEIRQDLIADERGQAAWAERLCRLLPRARAILNGKD